MKSTRRDVSGRSVVVAVMAAAGWMLAGCGGTTVDEEPAVAPTEVSSEAPRIAGSELGLPDQISRSVEGDVQAMATSCACCAGFNPACVIFNGNGSSAYKGTIQQVNGRWQCVCNTAPWNFICTTNCF